MPAEELWYRLREKYRLETDRIRFQAGIGLERDREFEGLLARYNASCKNYLQCGPARRFYLSTHSREDTAAFIAETFPGWIDQAIYDAEQLCEHRISLLGYPDLRLGRDINWHRDPVTGHAFPRQYWADFDLVHSTRVDPKSIHELNRHQHVPRLAKAFFLTGDERFAREAVAQLESWISQNPKWSGVNWRSSLDIGLRAISWMWTIFLLLPSRSLDEQATRAIMKALLALLDQVYRYPSTYSSPNTHLTGESTALLMAGLLFPELPRSQDWRKFGSSMLINEMQRQVTEDGVYGELSPYYHCYTVDFYLQALILAKLNRFPFPDWVSTRLSQMVDFVTHVSRPDGSIPLIGDDDGGRALKLSREHYGSFRDGLSTAAVLFGRSDFKHQAGVFQEETLWLLGLDGWEVFNSMAAEPPSQLNQSYEKDGYFIERSGWDADDSHAIFDCGGFGIIRGGHAHADALSFTLFSGGQQLLIDSGTSVYNCAPEWRNFFRCTSAHNTVVVDGQSQSEPGETFAWNRKANARLRKHIVRAGFEYIDGEHDGYALFPQSVIHRRRFIYIRPNYWIVLDELTGRGEHEFQFLYHFAPGAELMVLGEERRGEVDCKAKIGETGLQMFLYASGPLRAEAVCGQTGPIQGWCSNRYGERRPSPVLRATLHEFVPATMLAFLVPGARPARSRRFDLGDRSAVAAAIRDGEHDDIAVVSSGRSELHLIDCAMKGEFFWLRTENGVLKQLFAVNARAFTYGGEKVFDSREPTYVVAHFWDNGIVIERGEDEGNVYVRDLRDRQFQRK
jgi:Heparinase II/III-like protein/Heparinase II/III N-terminus